MESHTRVTSEWEELFSQSRISAHVISEELGQILMQYDLSAHTKMFDEVDVSERQWASDIDMHFATP